MHLSEALDVVKGDVISLVGAGGKTTAMYRLGCELAGRGWRVITTTTTMIHPPLSDQSQELIVEDRADRALRRVGEALQLKNSITLASQRLSAENKLRGIEPEWVRSLRSLADVVIIEADGARGLPLKAPAAHEPVVPTETTLFIPVCGITALGRQLTAHAVHRPELVARLTGLACGELVTDEAIVRLLLHPLGGLKGAPAQARVQPLLNQVSNAESLAAARRIAARVKADPSVDRVLIGAVATESPVLEIWRRVAAVVLAAGESRRLGRPKQLLTVGQTTMIEHVSRTVLGAHLDQVVVVLGSRAAEIAPHVAPGARSVWNADWSSGISSSIRTGLSAVNATMEAALFVLADQPQLTSSVLEHIVRAYYSSDKSIVVPAYQGRRGSPVLFDRRHFDELKALQGDVGGRAVAQRHPECVLEVELAEDFDTSWEAGEILADIDTPADYERFLTTQSDASTCT